MFFSSKKKAQRELEALRTRQIDELLRSVPHIKILTADRSSFDLPFFLADQRTTVTLRIQLSSDFPTQAPALQVLGSVMHPWLNQQKQVTGHPMIQRWSKDASLGNLVLEVSQRLAREAQLAYQPVPSPGGYPGAYPGQVAGGQQQQQQHPPPHQHPPQGAPGLQPPMHGQHARPSPYHSPAASPIPSPRGSPHRGPVPAPSRPQEPPTAAKYRGRLPKVPPSFPNLDTMSVTELQLLMNDTAKFQAFFEDLGPVQAARSITNEIEEQNEQIAQSNVERIQEIQEHKEKIRELRERVSAAQSEFEQLFARQQQLAQRFTAHGVGVMLAAKADTYEVQSDNVRQLFVEGNYEPQAFLKDFAPLRKEYHYRLALRERLIASSH